jgi:hypothetical protein
MSTDSSQTAPASPLDISPSESEQLGQTGMVRQWLALLRGDDSPSDVDANHSLLEETPANPTYNAEKRSPSPYDSENQENHRPVLGEFHRCSLTMDWQSSASLQILR